jgi:hypothetical protein
VGTEQLNTSYNVVDVAGFSDDDLKTVVTYLQKEIRASRRNVGTLKLSNLLNSIASRRTSTSAKSGCVAHQRPLPSASHPPSPQF